MFRHCIKLSENGIESNEDIVAVVDTGLALDHALFIGDEYLTYYALTNSSPYPTLQDTVSGKGFYQLVKVSDWGHALNDGANVVVFTDIGFGALADLLRKHGYAVFGTDAKSEMLESDRLYSRRILEKLDIPIPDADVVKGIEKLKQLIAQSNERRFIKPSFIRGEFETFGCDNLEELKIRLATPGIQLLGDSMTFVAEKELDGIEIGFDAFISKDGFLDTIFFTLEAGGRGNATVAVDRDDNPWSDFLNKIEPWLVKNGYTGMFCAEGFYDGDKVVVTDITCRPGYLCSHAYPRMISNFAEVVTEVAKGESPDIDLATDRSLQIGLYTDVDAWNIVCSADEFEEVRQFFGLRKGIMANGYVFTVPGDCTLGAFVSLGNRMSRCFDRMVEYVDKISIPSTYVEPFEFWKYFTEQRDKLSEYGFDF